MIILFTFMIQTCSSFLPGLYLTGVMVITGVSLTASCFLLYIHHSDGERHVPRWLRIITQRLATILCLHMKHRQSEDVLDNATDASMVSFATANGENIKTDSAQNGDLFKTDNAISNATRDAKGSDTNKFGYVKLGNEADLDQPGWLVQALAYLKTMSGNMTYIKARLEKQERQTRIKEEWRMVVRVLDRVLFIFFLLFDIIAVFGLFIIYPAVVQAY